MIRIWARMAWLMSVLGLAGLGCRATPPNTKPPASPEVLNPPPQEARFNSSAYPKQAYQQDDILKKKMRDGEANPIMPARGSTSPSMGRGGGY